MLGKCLLTRHQWGLMGPPPCSHPARGEQPECRARWAAPSGTQAVRGQTAALPGGWTSQEREGRQGGTRDGCQPQQPRAAPSHRLGPRTGCCTCLTGSRAQGKQRPPSALRDHSEAVDTPCGPGDLCGAPTGGSVCGSPQSTAPEAEQECESRHPGK